MGQKNATQKKLPCREECVVSPAAGEAIVHRDKRGRVRPEWLSACSEQRALTHDLMERVVSPSNLNRAYCAVVRNGGSAGVDGMTCKELKQWLKLHGKELMQQLRAGQYQPQTVRGVKIPKPTGGYRQLGIPSVVDRLIQQAMLQVLTPEYEKIFSEHSYGFRPHRSAHDALRQATQYCSEGKSFVIDLDLEKFFDQVNHHRLMWLLGTRIGDERILKLIHRFLKAGLMEGGLVSQRTKGTPQGGPLSPLLSNIVLDELDKELERRGHSYVRYADDVKIFVGSQQAAERVKQTITRHITEKLILKVNETKSRICRGHELNFLGHSILSGGRIGLSEESEQRLKRKVRDITKRNRGISFEQVLHELHTKLHGWLLYFRHATMQKKIQRLDEWLKHKLRCYRLKQCKRVIGIVRLLRKLGVQEKLSWKTALSGKGWWRLSNSPALNIGMNNQWLIQQGYYSLTINYRKFHV